MLEYRPAPQRHDVVREGSTVVVSRAARGDAGVELPRFCVKCGAPGAGLLKRTFYWHPPWVYLFILPGVLVYAILAYVLRKRMDLGVPLCPAHRSRRTRLILTAWLVALAGVGAPFLFGALNLDLALGWLLLVGLLLAAGVMGAIVSNPISPKRIDEVAGTFTGCGEAFLNKLS